MVADSLIVCKYDAPSKAYAALPKGAAKRKAHPTGSSEDDYEDEDGMDGEDGRMTSLVHVCIKNKGWDLALGSTKGTIDFRKAKVGARLLFECNGEQVERKTTDPLTYDVLPSNDGRTASVELKIAVLSSQMEGALFLVEFHVVPMGSKLQYDVVSEPIRVVSKKSQLESGSSQKKRSRTTQAATREVVLDAISKMEDAMAQSQQQMTDLYNQNMRQAELIQSLLGRLETVTGQHGGAVAPAAPLIPVPAPVPTATTASLEDAFYILAQSLHKDTSNRAARLQQIAQGWDASTWQLFAEAYSILAPQTSCNPEVLPTYDDDVLPATDSRVFMNGSLNALFGL